MADPPHLQIDARGVAVPVRGPAGGTATAGGASTPPRFASAAAPFSSPAASGPVTSANRFGSGRRPRSCGARAALTAGAVLLVVIVCSRLSLPGSPSTADGSPSAAVTTWTSSMNSVPAATSTSAWPTTLTAAATVPATAGTTSLETAAAPQIPKMEVGWPCPRAVDALAGSATKLTNAYKTKTHTVVICSGASGSPYYYGVANDDPNAYVALAGARDISGFSARDGSTFYSVSNARLHIADGAQTLLDEKVIDHLP